MSIPTAKFSDRSDWWSGRPQPREDLETIPFVGLVSGETPAGPMQVTEKRRREVGNQSYGGRTPVLNTAHTDRHGLLKPPRQQQSVSVATSHGNLHLTSNEESRGFMPTADAVLFLREEYLGSRFRAPPARFYPTAWR